MHHPKYMKTPNMSRNGTEERTMKTDTKALKKTAAETKKILNDTNIIKQTFSKSQLENEEPLSTHQKQLVQMFMCGIGAAIEMQVLKGITLEQIIEYFAYVSTKNMKADYRKYN